MTDKELRKLKRSDLLEILFYMREENDSLREENNNLKARIDELSDPVILHNNIKEAVAEAVKEYFNQQKGGNDNGRTEENNGHPDSTAV